MIDATPAVERSTSSSPQASGRDEESGARCPPSPHTPRTLPHESPDGAATVKHGSVTSGGSAFITTTVCFQYTSKHTHTLIGTSESATSVEAPTRADESRGGAA